MKWMTHLNSKGMRHVAGSLCLMSACLLHPTNVLAKSPSSRHLPTGLFVTVGGGGTWVNLPNQTTVGNGLSVSPPNNMDTLSIDSPSTLAGILALGYRVERNAKLIPYYDLVFQYQHTKTAPIKGVVTQFSSPGFENYNYRFNFDTDVLTIGTKLLITRYGSLLPYITGGFGIAINNLNDYSETPTAGVTARTSPTFTSKTNMNGVVRLGLGVDYIICDSTWLSLGYEHIFQGGISSGLGTDSWSGRVVKFNRISMDTVFASLTYRLPSSNTSE